MGRPDLMFISAVSLTLIIPGTKEHPIRLILWEQHNLRPNPEAYDNAYM